MAQIVPKMKDNLLVSNELVNAVYNYSALEINIMLHLIHEVQKRDTENVRLMISQLIDDPAGGDYTNVKIACTQLLKKPLTYYSEINQSWFICNIITSATIGKNTGLIHCTVHPKIKQAMQAIKSNYTRIETQTILNLRSKHAKKLYMLLCKFRKTGVYYVAVDDFRKLTDTSNKYEQINDLKKRVIDPALNEINAMSEYQVNYEFTKVGRQLNEIIFSFKLNNSAVEVYGNDKQIKFMKMCGLSTWQIENVLKQMTPTDLHPILYQFNLHKDKAKNKGAYLAKMLMDAGVDLTQKLINK